MNSKLGIALKTAYTIHKIIDPNPIQSVNSWQRRADIRRGEIRNMTIEQRLQMFNAIIDADWNGSLEYTKCLYKKREKKRVEKIRKIKAKTSTKKPKRRTTKAEYESMKKSQCESIKTV